LTCDGDVRLQKPLVFVLIAGALLTIIGLGFVALTRVEENDAFCASCHSQPEAAYFGRAQSSAAIDLASAHAMLAHTKPQLANTRCIDCHAGPGLMGRVSSVSLGARDAIRWFSGTSIQPAQQTTSINDANCLKCHADTPNANSFDQHFHATLARWQRADAAAATCVTCHAAHITGGNAALGFILQQRTQDVCKRCHTALGVDK